jgi:GNAT superfamily N-acetyltransferase
MIGLINCRPTGRSSVSCRGSSCRTTRQSHTAGLPGASLWQQQWRIEKGFQNLIMLYGTVPHPAHPGEAYSEHIVVRRPSPADIAGLKYLFSEMQRHYGRPVSDKTANGAARLACKPPVNSFDPRVLIALMDEAIVGSLVMNVTFPAFELTRSLCIRDLYVAERARRCGVARVLMKAGARLAISEGFSALEWTTDSANAAARKMYEACGARQLARIYYRLFDDDLTYAAG